MESLESKLEKLAPEQRREVEDFVDFLIFRSGESQTTPADDPAGASHFVVGTRVLGNGSPFPCSGLVPSQDAGSSHAGSAAGVPHCAGPVSAEESRSNGDDWITRDYIDYGKFEQATSPATEAVKKVKQKISQREEQEKSHQLLDWID